MPAAAWSAFCIFSLTVAAALAQTPARPGTDPAPASDRAPLDRMLGRGVNFGNMLEAPNEGDWGLFVEERFFDLAADAGFDHIRLPISWTHHAGDNPPYTIDPAFMARVDWCVDQALARDLDIIVNNHHHAELNADPVGEAPRALAIWRQIATRMQDRPGSVFFEVLNEPHGVFNDQPELWNQFLADALAEIRATNPQRWVLAGPVSWNAIGALQSFEPPADPRLIVTVHYYEPFAFTHQGASWVDPPPPVGTTWTGEEYTVATPWQNWSWSTSLEPGDDGMTVTYHAGWAGLYFRRGSRLEGVQRIVFEVDAALNLNVIVGNDDTDAAHPVQTTGPGVYAVDLPAGTPPVERVMIQNATSNPVAPFTLRAARVETASIAEPLIVTQREAIDLAMQQARAWSGWRRMPLYLGEFGAYSAADMDSRVRWTRAVRESAERNRIGWGYWELAAGFGIYDPVADAWRVPLLEALVD